MRITLIVLFVFHAFSVSAVEYRVPAEPGKAQALIDSGKLVGGDQLVLAPGRHGRIIIDRIKFDQPVLVTGAKDAPPEVDQLIVNDSSGWRFEGLTIEPGAEGDANVALVQIRRGKDIQLDRLIVLSSPDSSNWTARDWRDEAHNGIEVSGEDIRITNSSIRNVRHGIASTANGAWIEGNSIELFSGDGIRGLGDHSSYIGNTIETCVKVDDNHDDGFQSWSRNALGLPGKGAVRNVRLENNVIRNGNHPFKCHLQGIGLFDGFYEDWIIRGNTVFVDHWHGITVMGARRVSILDNTVVDSRSGKPGAPWIAITSHKDGQRSEDSTIQGNIMQPWSGTAGSPFRQPQPGVTFQDNRIVTAPEEAISAQP
ncbi:right-handed parallel beta-helix repeat-containing protein [Aestuariivita boseongensis]|uniref:right-handed parallel beta-helix repeat-containing protein n=1 Tax=Aestuariivita boseongensis TaxID=1470562 RepID=UPI00155DD0E0|nr:right-handed parallel beta-helix repeat-containing protein [Aestuariivita boseongensis]